MYNVDREHAISVPQFNKVGKGRQPLTLDGTKQSLGARLHASLFSQLIYT